MFDKPTKVRRSIRSNTHRGFVDYHDCDAICDELSDCLDFGEERLDKGQTLTAFEVTLYILLTGADLASSADSSFGSLTFAKHYPQVIYELYRIEIIKAAKESANRSQYGKLCGLIKELHQAGGKDEALALADQFVQEYKRRPAMLDELAVLKRKLTSSAKASKGGFS